MADAIANGSINIEQGGGINYFGCNGDAFASHLSYDLGQRGRGDISVTGATNYVMEMGGRAFADKRTYGLSEGKPGVFNTYKAGKFVSNGGRTKSYK